MEVIWIYLRNSTSTDMEVTWKGYGSDMDLLVYYCVGRCISLFNHLLVTSRYFFQTSFPSRDDATIKALMQLVCQIEPRLNI